MKLLELSYLPRSQKNLLLRRNLKPLGQNYLLQSLSCLPPKQSLRLLVLSLTLQLRSCWLLRRSLRPLERSYLQQSLKNLPPLQMMKPLERNCLLR